MFALPSHLFIFFICVCSALALRGSVSLDSLTFDKVISRFSAILVKFDVQYSHGESQDEYGVVAESLKNAKDFIVADVGIHDYGNHDNQDLADRFGITKDDFPVLKLFLQNNLESPLTFPASEEFKAQKIVYFVKNNTGSLILLDNCLQDFDELAEIFMASTTSKEMKEKVLNEAKRKAESLSEDEKKSAEVYLYVMEKVVERGDKFVLSELERVKNTIAGKVSEEKKEEMLARRNILQSFMLNYDPRMTKTEL